MHCKTQSIIKEEMLLLLQLIQLDLLKLLFLFYLVRCQYPVYLQIIHQLYSTQDQILIRKNRKFHLKLSAKIKANYFTDQLWTKNWNGMLNKNLNNYLILFQLSYQNFQVLSQLYYTNIFKTILFLSFPIIMHLTYCKAKYPKEIFFSSLTKDAFYFIL